MAEAWAYQDCERPLDLSDKWATNINISKGACRGGREEADGQKGRARDQWGRAGGQGEGVEKARTEVA